MGYCVIIALLRILEVCLKYPSLQVHVREQEYEQGTCQRNVKIVPSVLTEKTNPKVSVVRGDNT